MEPSRDGLQTGTFFTTTEAKRCFSSQGPFPGGVVQTDMGGTETFNKRFHVSAINLRLMKENKTSGCQNQKATNIIFCQKTFESL